MAITPTNIFQYYAALSKKRRLDAKESRVISREMMISSQQRPVAPVSTEDKFVNAQKFFEGNYEQFGIWDDNLLNQIDNFKDNEADKRLAFLTQNIFENISKLDKSNVLSKSKEEYYNYCSLNYNKNLS